MGRGGGGAGGDHDRAPRQPGRRGAGRGLQRLRASAIATGPSHAALLAPLRAPSHLPVSAAALHRPRGRRHPRLACLSSQEQAGSAATPGSQPVSGLRGTAAAASIITRLRCTGQRSSRRRPTTSSSLPSSEGQQQQEEPQRRGPEPSARGGCSSGQRTKQQSREEQQAEPGAEGQVTSSSLVSAACGGQREGAQQRQAALAKPWAGWGSQRGEEEEAEQ